MVYVKWLLVLFALFQFCEAIIRIEHRRCGQGGFTCVTNINKKRNIFYDCPSGVTDIMLYINIMDAPADMERLYIRNCESVTVATRCSGENRFMSYLELSNIKRLSFVRYQYEPMLPPVVHLENINYIDTIPYHTFAQVENQYYSAGCSVPKSNFESITMKNVNIGEIQSGAIEGLNKFKNATFINVKIGRLQTSAIKLKLDTPGEFKFQDSSINYVDHLGFQLINTRRVTFSGNKITELSASAINGTIDEFFFVNNTVKNTQANSFSLLATSVFMMNNTFMQMKSGALEKISPGLIQDSGRNFGKLKFLYDFSKNVINFVEAGGLHPDYLSYENVQTEMVFKRNQLFCSCENLGWLFSELGYGSNSLQLKTFYDKIKDEKQDNMCFHKCIIPLNNMKHLISHGKCLKNITIESKCDPGIERPTKVTISNTTLPDSSTSRASKTSVYVQDQNQSTTEIYLFSCGLKLFKDNIICIIMLVQILNLLIN